MWLSGLMAGKRGSSVLTNGVAAPLQGTRVQSQHLCWLCYL